MISHSKDDFMAALDAQGLQPADAIIVLRNWDKRLTYQRFRHAYRLMERHHSDLLLMSYDGNTREEAQRVSVLLDRLNLQTVTIVTHRSHHYRAWLTFAKQFRHSQARLQSSPVESPLDPEEFEKIERYAAQGDLLTYEEGLKDYERYSR